MKRPKFITEAQARELTRREILDHLDEWNAYWKARPPKTEADHERYREYGKILHLIDPGDAIDDIRNALVGKGTGDYWDTKPGTPPAEEPGA